MKSEMTVQTHAPAVSVFSRIYWHLNRTKLAWWIKAIVTMFHWREKVLRRRLASTMEIESNIATEATALNRNGYAYIGKLMDDALLEELLRESMARAERADRISTMQSVKHKDFWVRLLDEDTRDGFLDSDNVFVRFALQPNVIKILTVTMHEIPMLVDIYLTLSRESKSDLSYSQLWHRDHDDVRTIKLFAYLTDVQDTDDGPFTFIPRPESERFGYSARSHIDDDTLFHRISKSAVCTVQAPKLTTFMVETSRCLHMGSRVAPGHSRLMYAATYILSPRVYSSERLLFRVNKQTPLIDRLILGM